MLVPVGKTREIQNSVFESAWRRNCGVLCGHKLHQPAEIMVFCAATNCTNHSKSKVSTFKFPTDPKIREEWLKNLKRESFQPTKYSRLCENHFTKESFDESYAIKLSLGLKPGKPQLKKTQYQLFLTSPTLDETRKEEGLVKMKVSFRPLRNAESWR